MFSLRKQFLYNYTELCWSFVVLSGHPQHLKYFLQNRTLISNRQLVTGVCWMFPIVSIFSLLAPAWPFPMCLMSVTITCQLSCLHSPPASLSVRHLSGVALQRVIKWEIIHFKTEISLNRKILLPTLSLWSLTKWEHLSHSPSAAGNSGLWDGESFLTLSKVAQCCADQTSTTMWAGLSSGPWQR